MTKELTGTTEIVEQTDKELSVIEMTPKDHEVTVGNQFNVMAVIKNTGDVEVKGEAIFAFGDENHTISNREVTNTLSPGDTWPVSFDGIQTEGLSPGTYSHSVSVNIIEDSVKGDPPENSVAKHYFGRNKAKPGEQVQLTAEIPIEEVSQTADYGVKFDNNFEKTEFLGASIDGNSVGADMTGAFPDAVLYAGDETSNVGTLMVQFGVIIPKNSESGTVYTTEDPGVQVDGKEITLEGKPELTVV